MDYYTPREVFGLLRVFFECYSYYYGTSHVECFCNSLHVRNLLVMVLWLNESLKLAESIVSICPQKTAQAQHQLMTRYTVNTPLLVCYRQCERRPLSDAPPFHAERRLPQTAADLNISNNSIKNTLMFHTRRIWLLPAHPNAFNTLSVVNTTLTKI